MINFKQFLLEVNAEHNGTGGTQPPTVIYPYTTRDSPETRSIFGDPEQTQDQFNNQMWQTWIYRYRQQMESMGATPEQIANMLRLMRQEFVLYQSSAMSGNLNMGQIHQRMLQFVNNLFAQQSWYQSYWREVKNRGRLNYGINKVNRFTLNFPGIPGIPNVNSSPSYGP